MKVDATSSKLLTPVIERCNPGTAGDVTEYTGNPEALRKQWEQDFKAPLDSAFQLLSVASGSERSPILESIQSVALTEFQTPQAEGKPRKLIVASDLLQNTDRLSFYGRLPTADEVLASDAFRAARTDLRGIDVELWMLQRTDSSSSQPRALPDLWDAMITEEGGNLTREYTVSG